MRTCRSAVAALALLSMFSPGGRSARASAVHSGRVLSTANWQQGIRGWSTVGPDRGWSVKGGNLTASSSVASALLAPITITAGRPYTVEARIRVVRGAPDIVGYGIVVAASSHGSTADGIFGAIDRDGADLDSGTVEPGLGFNFSSETHSPKSFRPRNSWHLYRLSVRGSRFVFSIDGKTFAAAGDSTYRNRPRVGLYTSLFPIAVRSFRVVSPQYDSAEKTRPGRRHGV